MKPVIDPGKCILNRSCGWSCLYLCLDYQVGAIVQDGRVVRVTDECTGCGECVPVCPEEAITMEEDNE